MTTSHFYVYGYYDPNTNEIFYIGKGAKQRDRAHLKPSCWKHPKSTNNVFFYQKIKSLMENGTPPIIKRLHENITEDEAYDIEAELIAEHGRRFVDGGILFNISSNRGGPSSGKKVPWSDERRTSYKNMWANKRVANDKEELAEMFLERSMTRKEIANYYGVSEVLIKKRLQEYKIQKNPDQKKNTLDRAYAKSRKVLECEHCKNQFEVAASHDRKFCSSECSSKSRLSELVFRGVRYENKYDAAEKTGLSSVYLQVYKDK
jgi:transposase-like protein